MCICTDVLEVCALMCCICVDMYVLHEYTYLHVVQIHILMCCISVCIYVLYKCMYLCVV